MTVSDMPLLMAAWAADHDPAALMAAAISQALFRTFLTISSVT